MKLSVQARAFIYAFIVLAIAAALHALTRWQCDDFARFLAYGAISLAASTLKVRLPGVTGTMSVNFLFVLIGITELSIGEAILIAAAAVAVQCYWHARVRPQIIQVAFNVASIAVAVTLSSTVLHASLLRNHVALPIALVLAACTHFIANTFPIACIIALTERKPLRHTWKECYLWSFAYYLLGATIAAFFHYVAFTYGWEAGLLVLPIVYSIYKAYRLYLGRLQDKTEHAEQIASLHLRTIEALALAIDAKDHTTHDHLRRVQIYAVEIGQELGLSDDELQALRAAALLHDIGKLAVPEQIISKPGKLTPEEFEKMKIHPAVGAEILQQVQFPYPVVPIVRSHHEKWNGTGYPDGLSGERIPIGARILAAVDCLDALASDRQYRKALPLEAALAVVVSEANISYDPKVVDILHRRYKELEGKAHSAAIAMPPLSMNVRVERGAMPATGFEQTKQLTESHQTGAGDFIAKIGAARQEVQMLFELSQELGTSLSLNETLSMFAVRLKHMIPHDAVAIYVIKGDRLVPEFVSGEGFRTLSALEIPMGQGLSGWVAENKKPILNGNPAVAMEGTAGNQQQIASLHAALAVPLEAVDGVVGVLTLYQTEKDAFSKEHLRLVLALSSKVALAIENALKFREAQSSAKTDYLTGLPNARSLFVQLDSELARAQRVGANVAVLVADLDGFKQVNDRFGHLTGNRVLQEVAGRLRNCCREYDYVARMGGDEFVMVLPGATGQHALAKEAQLCRTAMEAGLVICHENTLGLSVGIAMYPQDGMDAESLLAAADRRMYKMKQSQKPTRRVMDLDHITVPTNAVVH